MVKINKRYWWLSDLTSVTKEWEFVYSKNIEADHEKITLWKTTTKMFEVPWGCWNILEIIKLRSWNEYKNAFWGHLPVNEDWTALSTAMTSEIAHAVVYNSKLYSWAGWVVNYMLESDAYSQTNRDPYTTWSHATYTWSSVFSKEFWGVLYVVTDKTISTLDASNVYTDDVLTSPETIVWIWANQGSMRIFLINWDILLRDGITDNYHSKTSIWEELRFGFSIWNTDILVWGTDVDLSSFYMGVYPNYKLEKKRVGLDNSLYWTDAEKFAFQWLVDKQTWNSTWATRQWYIYLSSKTSICKIWRESAMFPLWYTSILENDDIGALATDYDDWSIVYYNRTDTSVYKIWTTTFNDGEVYSRVFNYWTDDVLTNEIKVDARWITDTANVKLYVSINWAAFTQYWNTLNITGKTNIYTLRKAIEYNSIQFKIELIDSASDSDLAVYEIDFNALAIKK